MWTVNLTPPQRRALEVLAAHTDGLTPTEFGAEMWPEAGGHIRGVHKIIPHGAVALKAGQFLSQLDARGLLSKQPIHGSQQFIFGLSKEGRQALQEVT